MHVFIAPIILAVLLFAALRLGVIGWLAARPVVTVVIAAVVGVVYRQFGAPTVDGEIVREGARVGLALLGFFAAQQCRLSRVPVVSAAALRLALLGTVMMLWAFTFTGFFLLPGLGLLGTLLVGAAIMLSGAPTRDERLLDAPINPQARCTARIEGAVTLALTLPVAILFEIAANPAALQAPVHTAPVFKALAGFALGGGLGLVIGRFVSLPKTGIPVLPFLLAGGSYALGILTGFDAVMTTLGAALLFSEEAPMPGDMRSRIWRLGEGLVTPPAWLAFGFIMAPLVLGADVLSWIAAVALIIPARIGIRSLALQGLEMPAQDKRFLIGIGGGPGAATALFLIALLASPATVVEEEAIVLGAVTLVASLAIARWGSGALIDRFIQASALAKKRRYETA